MALVRYSVQIVGNQDLIMHSDRSLDPTDPMVIEMGKYTKKRTKTIDDHRIIAGFDFMLSCYYRGDAQAEAMKEGDRWALPSEMIEANLLAAARQSRKGKDCATLIVTTPEVLIIFPDMDKTPRQLFQANGEYVFKKNVRIKQAKVQRVRCKISDWSLGYELEFDNSDLNPGDVHQFLIEGGRRFGLGDWRQRYGKFGVKSFEEN